MRQIILSILIALIDIHSSEAVIGDFSEARNLPGYINLDPNSRTFKGPNTNDVQRNDGVIIDTPSELISKFMINGRINTIKIRQLITDILRYQENARIAYCQVKQSEEGQTQVGCKNGFPNPELAINWGKKDVNLGLSYAVQRFEEAIHFSQGVGPHNINKIESQDFLEAFFDGFEIYQSIVSEDMQLSDGGAVSKLLKPLQKLVQPTIIKSGRVEAANLMKDAGAGGDIFYSPEELEILAKQGFDISLLNPPDSGFWRRPKQAISQYDTSNYNKEEKEFFDHSMDNDQFEELVDRTQPISVSYKLKETSVGGDTPKLFVNFGNTLFKLKFTTDRMGARRSTHIVNEAFKVIRGMEVNTETVVNNLAAALGFTVDGTYNKDVVRLFFNDEIYEKNAFDSEHQKMMKIFDEKYTVVYNTSSAFKFVKIDPATGRKYIELKNVQLERAYSVETDMNIGHFIRKGLGKSLKREHRAFTFFLAWIWDTDTKDSNTGLKLIPYVDGNGKTRYRLAMANSDMGAALASSRPNFYNFRLIRDFRKDANGNLEYMKLNFWRIYALDTLSAVSFADAKWMARLIAQLTPAQIFQASIAAGYPDVVAKYYTGLLLKKRNQLLEVLGLMGETFPGVTGEEITIEPTEEFTGSINGYEEFFREGFLTDPENKLFEPKREHYPQYWGAGIKKFKGEPQEYFIKMVKFTILSTAGNALYRFGLKDLNITNHGFNFNEFSLRNASLAQDCKSRCFFQGFYAGVSGFVPWRFLISNPDPDAKAPFLLIDMFRFGFILGNNVQHNFGVSIPETLTLGLGLHHTQMSEYIKIRPIMDLEEFFNSKPNPFTAPTLQFKTAKDDTLKSLQENEILIQSHYIGNRADAEIRADLGSYFPVSPSLSFTAGLMTANRVTFQGKGESEVYAGWENLSQAGTAIALNVRLTIARLPIIKHEIMRLRNTMRTFKFDLSIPEDKEVLKRNINRLVPSDIPSKYALKQRSMRTRQQSISLGFFTFFRRTSSQRSIRVDFNDFENNTAASNLTYEKVTNKVKTNRFLGVHSTDYKVQASMDSRHSLFAKVKFVGTFNNMTRIYFKNLLYNFSPILPDNFIQFEPESVKQNFGTLGLDIETILPEKGLEDAFHPDIKKFGLCKLYAKVHHVEWDDDLCARLSRSHYITLRGLAGSENEKRFVQFWRKYSQARFTFWNFVKKRVDGVKNGQAMVVLKELVNVLMDNNDFDFRAMNMFASLARADNLYRRASMSSSYSAFPGGEDSIVQDVNAQGRFTPTIGMLSNSPEDEFELFTDVIHDAVGSIFWNQRGGLSLMPKLDRI